MILRCFLIISIILASVCARADVASVETCRIRIENRIGGLVQVSVDEGRTYGAVGRVTAAANARISGFGAASYTPRGTIAATATHGIRIKTGQNARGIETAQMPLMFSIVPKEFSTIPNRYGGHQPRSSGIQTDIYSGRSIFREFSPRVGNPVYIELGCKLDDMPEDYIPAVGDVFVIIVRQPSRMPREIEIENRVQGKVTAIFADGKKDAIAEVARPVWGIGRYDGTTFTGTGFINTNHGGVLTIGSAPTCPPNTLEGGKIETRGGFMIQPFFHDQAVRDTSPQVMVIAPQDRTKPVLEGTPPLYSSFIGLSREHKVQVKIDNGQWESVPAIVGRVDNGLTGEYLTGWFAKQDHPRDVKTGVTAIRVIFPEATARPSVSDLKKEASEYSSRAATKGIKTLKGTTTLSPSKKIPTGSIVTFYIDGRPAYTANSAPYRFEWDTKSTQNGLHCARIEAASDYSTVVENLTVMVRNDKL